MSGIVGNGFMGIKKGGGVLPYRALLNEYPDNCTGAWATFKLREDYNGPCILARRETDLSEIAIGFGDDGEIDRSAIVAFSGGAIVTVRRIYDQTGLERDFVVSTGDVIGVYDGSDFVTVNEKVALKIPAGGITLNVPGSKSGGWYEHIHNGTTSTIIHTAQFSESTSNGIFAMFLATGRSSAQVGFRQSIFDNAANVSRANTAVINTTATLVLNSTGANNSAILGAQSLNFDVIDADNSVAADRSKKWINNGGLIAENTSTAPPSLNESHADLTLSGGLFATNRDVQFFQCLAIYDTGHEDNRLDIQNIINEMYNVF